MGGACWCGIPQALDPAARRLCPLAFLIQQTAPFRVFWNIWKNCANSQLSCALKKTIRNARAILLSLPGSNQRHYLFPLNKVAAVRILMADDITEIRDDKRKTDFLFVGSIEKKADVIGAKLSFDTEVTCPLFFQLIKKPKNPRAHFLLYMKNKIERASFSHANRYTTIALLFFILPVGHWKKQMRRP